MKMHLECLGNVELECEKNTDKHQGDNDSDYSQIFSDAFFDDSIRAMSWVEVEVELL